MFLSQPSAQVMILTGQNTSLPIHTTVVQEASSVIFTLDTATTYNKWVLGILDVDMEGNVRLTEGWEEIFWKQTKKLKYKGNHKIFIIKVQCEGNPVSTIDLMLDCCNMKTNQIKSCKQLQFIGTNNEKKLFS